MKRAAFRLKVLLHFGPSAGVQLIHGGIAFPEVTFGHGYGEDDANTVWHMSGAELSTAGHTTENVRCARLNFEKDALDSLY